VYPAFYQCVTQELFKKIIEEAFPVGPPSSKSTSSSDRCTCSGGSLNYVEQNAIYYTCSWLHMQKFNYKIKFVLQNPARTIMQCLSEMAGNDDLDVNLSSED